jgi:hypothetical protein
MVLDGRVTRSVIDNDFSYATTLLPYQPSGCPASRVDSRPRHGGIITVGDESSGVCFIDSRNRRGVAAMSPEGAQAVASRAELVGYLVDLANRVRDGQVPAENTSASDSLRLRRTGLEVWTASSPVRARMSRTPSWATIAMILFAALVYE